MKEILKMQKEFYSDLYQAKSVCTNLEIVNYLNNCNIPKITSDQQIAIDAPLSLDECYETLKTFKPRKSPGNDGITSEFYKKFWPVFGKFLLNSFNESFDKGELSVSQRQAVITLLDKNKDRTLLKCWRPISLLNVDYKIVSKTLARRLVDVLPNIVHNNQVGYVKGRYIGQNIRTAIDILQYTKLENKSGILISVDFEKAFDSVEWSFMIEVLKKFNFGEIFLKWIKLFYKNAESCTINNGLTSGYFQLSRGVRQGDPLSPYLFIICAEILAIKIRENKNIKGIWVEKEELKIIQFADDTNGLLADLNSAKQFLLCIEEFGAFSGLKINKEKSEALWLGKDRDRSSKPLGIHWPNRPVRILGIYISYNHEECEKKNVKEKLDRVKRVMNSWKQRNLSLLGKIQIVKSYLISTFQYFISMSQVSKNFEQELNKLLFSFIWNGKRERLKRDVLVRDIEKGGLNMPHLYSVILTSRLRWIKIIIFLKRGYGKGFGNTI